MIVLTLITPLKPIYKKNPSRLNGKAARKNSPVG